MDMEGEQGRFSVLFHYLYDLCFACAGCHKVAECTSTAAASWRNNWSAAPNDEGGSAGNGSGGSSSRSGRGGGGGTRSKRKRKRNTAREEVEEEEGLWEEEEEEGEEVDGEAVEEEEEVDTATMAARVAVKEAANAARAAAAVAHAEVVAAMPRVPYTCVHVASAEWTVQQAASERQRARNAACEQGYGDELSLVGIGAEDWVDGLSEGWCTHTDQSARTPTSSLLNAVH
jgi:hypothetical protein